MGLIDGFLSLAKNLNKTRSTDDDETTEGVVSETLDELQLDKKDDELITLSDEWEQRWTSSEAATELIRKRDENERYWLGDHYTAAQKKTGVKEPVDNLIFEAVETYLPTITRENPAPVVSHDRTPEGQALANKVERRLIDLVDTMKFKIKVRDACRHWQLYLLGCIKFGWSKQTNDITCQVRRPQLLILDPDATIEGGEYMGEYLGEYRTDTARDLITRFPAKSADITKKVNNKLGTRVRYIEWWTNDYIFWKMDREVLGKSRNPHWNYEQNETVQTTNEETGELTESVNTIPGNNFFSTRKIPYGFISVFNLGKHPFDDTNQVQQVIPQQDTVNKRTKQIDKNADQINGGSVVSGDHFTQAQASYVADALAKGRTVWVPKGDVNTAYKRDQGVALPSFVYENLLDSRNEIRGIFGTTGLSAQGVSEEKTVRGKILTRGADASRASLPTDYIEQLADYAMNWFVQLMYVYYDEPHNVSRLQGTDTILNTEFTHPITVSVKEGSMIPRDALTRRNEAVDLFTANALDPESLYTALDFPNPRQMAINLLLWQKNPFALYPEAMKAVAATLPPAPVPGAPPAEVPPEETPPADGGVDLLDEVPIPS